MRQVAGLLLRDANVTLDPTQTRNRVEQFVSDAYGQEEQIALVSQMNYYYAIPLSCTSCR